LYHGARIHECQIINTITHADYVKFASQSKTEQRHHKKFAFQVSTGLQYRMNERFWKFGRFESDVRFRAIKTRGIRQAGYRRVGKITQNFSRKSLNGKWLFGRPKHTGEDTLKRILEKLTFPDWTRPAPIMIFCEDDETTSL